jgi:hypothetical protein
MARRTIKLHALKFQYKWSTISSKLVRLQNQMSPEVQEAVDLTGKRVKVYRKWGKLATSVVARNPEFELEPSSARTANR